jgi:hypothetical protein
MAGGRTDGMRNSYLLLVFQNTNIANIGDATGLRGSTTVGSLYVALTTTASTAAAAGTEATYTGYARVAVARTSGGWTVAANVVSNAALVTFGQCTAGSSTVVSFEIWTAASGGTRLHWGDLTSSLAITTSSNQIPEFAIGALTVTAT